MNQNEDFTPIHLREREKLERLRENADLVFKWACGRLIGTPFEIEWKWPNDPGCWRPVTEEVNLQPTGMLLRRKPEPTLEERNLECRKRWDGMGKTSCLGIRKSGEVYFTWLYNTQFSPANLSAEPGWLNRGEYSLRECTLKERNAALRKEWDAMSLISTPNERHQTRSRGHSRFICECKYPHQSKEEWARANPDWAEQMEYRIVELPSPRIEPYTFETCPLGGTVEWKSYKQRGVVTACSDNEVSAGDMRYSYHEARDRLWLIPDPSKPERRPFGTVVA